MAISGKSVAVTLAGAVLAYSGIKGKRITTTMRDLIAGNNPAQNPQVDLPISSNATAVQPIDPTAQQAGSQFSTTVAAGRPRANMMLAKGLAAPFGWSIGQQWDALIQLWNMESGWNNTADNPQSHAYGIPQALPQTKMPLPARALYAGGISDPTTQILWGLTYIKQRYGNPVNALAHENSFHWY